MKGVSRIVGEAQGADGIRRPLYEALRGLLCSSCGASIPEGARFTRHGAGSGAEAILPRCLKCGPHELVGGNRSALLEALLTRGEEAGAETAQDARNLKAVQERLGPALARSRKRRE